MPKYNIRFADKEDIPFIMRFIDEEWKKGHILAINRELFDWQYVNNNKVNMVICEDENHVLLGILGYIPYAESEDKDFSLALWKAKNGTAFLGMKLFSFLLKEEDYRTVFCNGINMATTAQIYSRFGFEVDKLKQWYRLCNCTDYKIAKVCHKVIPEVQRFSKMELVRITDFSEFKKDAGEQFFDVNRVPYKSESYIFKRYFMHPIYDYMIYTLKKESGKFDTAIVFRIQECNNSRVLRVIDVLGDYNLIYDITNQIEQIAKEYDVEYMDMYVFGLSEKALFNAGWLLVGEDENIIPNYFSPYTQCNIEIHISTQNKNIVLFKGDGDQDRPN